MESFRGLKQMRYLIMDLERWCAHSQEYQFAFPKGSPQSEMHRGAKEAFARAASRARELYSKTGGKPIALRNESKTNQVRNGNKAPVLPSVPVAGATPATRKGA